MVVTTDSDRHKTVVFCIAREQLRTNEKTMGKKKIQIRQLLGAIPLFVILYGFIILMAWVTGVATRCIVELFNHGYTLW